MNEKTRRIAVVGMLSAIAYVVMLLIKVPVITAPIRLSFEPKDIIIVIGGFIYGPFYAFLISFIVSLIEMVTVSDTGITGLIMNVLSTCAFACTAAFIYKKNRTLKGAVTGLITGGIFMVGAMLLYNYLITPIYLYTLESKLVFSEEGLNDLLTVSNQKRKIVQTMLVPVFLPFNLLKAGINASVTMLLYKPVIGMLKFTKMLPAEKSSGNKGKINIGIIIASFVILVTCILFILAIRGII